MIRPRHADHFRGSQATAETLRRAVQVGVVTAWVGVAISVPVPLIPGLTTSALGHFAILAGYSLSTLYIMRLLARPDWAARVQDGHAAKALEVWGHVALVLLAINVGVFGGGPEFGHLYAMPILVYFLMLLPVGGGVRILVSALLAVAGLGVLGSVGFEALITQVGAIVLIAMLGGGAGQLLWTSAARSQQRERTLALVVAASRGVSDLDDEAAARHVVDAILDLGFDVALVGRRVGKHVFQPVAADGVATGEQPDELLSVPEVNVEGATVHAYDRLSYAHPRYSSAGMRTAVLAPVVVGRDLTGVILALSRNEAVAAADQEAVELLGRMMARALANADRFEQEQAAVRELEVLTRLKDDFISNVSHELRTPMTVIRGVTETLVSQNDRVPPDVRQDLLRRVGMNVRSLDRTIDHLLEFSRVQAGIETPNISTVALETVVAGTVDRLSEVLENHEVRLDSDARLFVRTDPEYVGRVVENLLVNAAKHTPAGTHVTVSVRRIGGIAEIAVSDDGPGVPADEVALLTERFFRGGEGDRRATRGLGLGLALSRELLAALDTQLEVTSVLGEGTRFSFRVGPLLGQIASAGLEAAAHRRDADHDDKPHHGEAHDDRQVGGDRCPEGGVTDAVLT